MTSGEPSERERAQHALAAYLRGSDFWRPYGVTERRHNFARGGALRIVDFGYGDVLDAHASLWSHRRIVVEGRGALAYAVAATYGSLDELLAVLRAIAGET